MYSFFNDDFYKEFDGAPMGSYNLGLIVELKFRSIENHIMKNFELKPTL